MTREAILKKALELSPAERVHLVDDLLESVVDPNDCAELSAEQQAELLQRREAYRADPDSVIPWEEVEKRIKHAE